jgi:hypothetical protein
MDMKKILLLTFTILLTATSFGQCLSVINGSKSFPFPPDRYNTYTYIDAGVDLGLAFSENGTLDYDVELGYRKNLIAVYGFFGEHRDNDYQNYGVGLDFFLYESRTIDVSVGPQVGAIYRGYGPNYFAYALRVKPTLALTEEVLLFGRIQYQHRPDLNRYAVLEPSLGVQFKIF